MAQVQSLHPRGVIWPFCWLIGKVFAAVAGNRLETIKAVLEQSAGEVCFGSRTVH